MVYGRQTNIGLPTIDLQHVEVHGDAAVVEALRNLQVVRELIDSKNLAAAGNYDIEDILSENATTGTPYRFRGAAREPNGSGRIEKAIIFCSVTALAFRTTLYLFSTNPTSTMADNAANVAPSVQDWPSFQGPIDFPVTEDLGGGSASVATPSTYGNLSLPYKCITGDLFGIAVTRDAITGEAVGMLLSIKLQVVLD